MVSQDKWLEALGRLRRTHLEQTRTLYGDEILALTQLNHQFRLALAQATKPLEKAIVIHDFVSDLKQFNWDSNERKWALRRRQSDEIYNLLLLKFSLLRES